MKLLHYYFKHTVGGGGKKTCYSKCFFDLFRFLFVIWSVAFWISLDVYRLVTFIY